MKYVYILESQAHADHFYVGVTDDLHARLIKHNNGDVAHTSKYGPWRVKTYVACSNEAQAFQFEKYLKSASGRAFAKKRLWRDYTSAMARRYGSPSPHCKERRRA